MRLYYEWGTRQLNKRGEELCGDSVAVSRHSDSVTLAMADGLGSGVKANILATLTTRIAMHLLENDLPLSEVVETLGRTLPVCKVRKLAYSTFAIAQFFRDGHARVVEFDTPPAIRLRERKRVPFLCEERVIVGKSIREAVVELKAGDWVVFVTDGVLNAGIGGRYPLGWGWDQASRYLEDHAHPELSAQDLADKMGRTVSELYDGPPGDDVSIVAIKVRTKLVATVLTGPPADRSKDESVLDHFIKQRGLHVVCGGTTAKMASRHLGQPLEVDLETMKPDVPPIAHMETVDLVTEGILTLTRANELLRSGAGKDTVRFQTDGAGALVRVLLDVDHVHFIAGLAVNPAHQNPSLPAQLGIKLAVVREIAEELRKRGTEVTIETA
ncbi:MAG TPA: PP2C family protein-serine/threonine phosphatase [Phycisphaerae bacterium]|nr:PP2C family protein-serine/threonine phosphatase [Phycisphaerae bacterium]